MRQKEFAAAPVVAETKTSHGGGKGNMLGLIPAEKIGCASHARPSSALIDRYRALLPDLTSTVADTAEQLGLRAIVPGSILRPISEGAIIGPAVTVRYGPARYGSGFSLANERKAPSLGGRDMVTLSESGDVLVIDSSADHEVSSFGGIMATTLVEAGMAGIVVDGSVRDVASMRQLGLKAWSRGVTPRTGKHRLELVEFNGTIEIHGVQVNPGDLLLADADGVVVIPFAHVEEVIERVEAAVNNERKLIDAINQGSDPATLANILPPHKW